MRADCARQALTSTPVWARDYAAGDPQTAIHEYGLPWAGLESAEDIASLDLARARYLRRQAMDAVDRLIALLDAIDATHEDLEPEAGYNLPEGDDDRCSTDQVDGEPWLGAPENHDEAPDQRTWAQGDMWSDHGECDDGDADVACYLPLAVTARCVTRLQLRTKS